MTSLLDLSYIQHATGEQLLVTDTSASPLDVIGNVKWMVAEQQMAYPPYFSNNLSLLLGFILPLFLVLSFAFVVPPILKRIVFEKETGVKELMKLMGLPSWMHWVCWFINVILSCTVSILIIVILVSIEFKSGTGAVLAYSDPILTFIFLLLYASSLVCFLFFISTFFDKPNLALALGVLIHILTFFIPNNTINRTSDGFTNYSFFEKNLMALIPNINLIWGIKMLTSSEGKGSGVQWATLFTGDSPDDPLSMGSVWIMFLVDILLYSLLISYIDKIAPGKFGVAEKFYFFLAPSYWRPGTRVSVEDGFDQVQVEDPSMFEAEPKQKAGIRVNNLKKEFRKTFGGETVHAVNGVTFSAYEGEITALLGHNGAGKTTTMSVLTGMFSPSSGSAVINGHNITTSMDKVRRSLGLCPQHNMLFEDLTVREHLRFFGMLKGMSSSAAVKDADTYIKMLNLVAKRNVNVTNLSGGMKRKVNLGIALIGGSQVVMLDEPTSGMDPEARREMWDLLTSLKRGRTILLTTHFMEEADVLGDRIAIMGRGRVRCCGSPFFLKKRFGHGYTLHVSKGKDFSDTARCTKMISGSVAGAELVQDTAEEVTYRLDTATAPSFPDMFQQLERGKQELDILNFGLDLTTMDDVFLKIGELEEAGDADDDGEAEAEDAVESVRKQEGVAAGSTQQLVAGPVSGLLLVAGQLCGLLAKRMVYTWRRKLLYLTMAATPVCMATFIVLSLNPFTGTARERPARTMDLASYDDPVTLVRSDGSPLAAQLQTVYSGLVRAGSAVLLGPGAELDTEIIARATGNQALARYRDGMVMAADLEQVTLFGGVVSVTQLTATYNSLPLHSRPLAQNYISNTLLRHLSPDTEKLGITVATHPLPEPKTNQFESLAQGGASMLTYGYGIPLPLGLAILVSSFLIFPLNERATNAKQVQLMTGLRPAVFWLANLAWDLLLYSASALTMYTLILALDQKETFLLHEGWGALALIILLFGMFGIPFSYAFSFLFNNAASGFAFLIIVNILGGCIAPTAVFLLRDFGNQFESDTLLEIASVLQWIFYWVPIFPYTRALMAIITVTPVMLYFKYNSVIQVQEGNNLCETGIDRETLALICEKYTQIPQLILANTQFVQCCKEPNVPSEHAVCGKDLSYGFGTIPASDIPCHQVESFFTWHELKGINLDIMMLFVDGMFYFLIIVMIETRILYKILEFVKGWIPGYYKYNTDNDNPVLDDDVSEEQRRVTANVESLSDVLKVFGLKKKFRRLAAVRDVSFGVKAGECFGLLGINGAGKTTSFRMLTGDETPSRGEAEILGYRLTQDRRKFLSQVGYCPQFDSIIPELTGREMLSLMARVRGVPLDRVAAEVDRWTRFLGIQEYIDRPSGSYSGGNKRKLNVAMSLVAEPPLIFLDEPSTGVDPVARRNLWRIIRRIQARGQSVVLTSHSMEECEALCDRLAIMVNGQFQCFGTVPHLKNKFALGFSILTKLRVTGSEEEGDDLQAAATLKDFVSSNLPNVEVKDEHKGYIHFHVQSPSTPWSTLFRVMEDARAEISSLEEYSISQTTLEQVFLNFAKKQTTDM